MKRLVQAVYTNGRFKPSTSIDLPEGTEVNLIVIPAETSSDEARELAMEVYNDLSEDDLREISQVAINSRGYDNPGLIDRAE